MSTETKRQLVVSHMDYIAELIWGCKYREFRFIETTHELAYELEHWDTDALIHSLERQFGSDVFRELTKGAQDV